MKRAYPVTRLMDVARHLESRSDAALQGMFRIAAAPQMPEYWRRGVDKVATLVLRGRDLEHQALLAARKGMWKEARVLIHDATQILKATRTSLRVTFLKPAEGSFDLGAWIVKEARRSAKRTSEQIAAKRL